MFVTWVCFFVIYVHKNKHSGQQWLIFVVGRTGLHIYWMPSSLHLVTISCNQCTCPAVDKEYRIHIPHLLSERYLGLLRLLANNQAIALFGENSLSCPQQFIGVEEKNACPHIFRTSHGNANSHLRMIKFRQTFRVLVYVGDFLLMYPNTISYHWSGLTTTSESFQS